MYFKLFSFRKISVKFKNLNVFILIYSCKHKELFFDLNTKFVILLNILFNVFVNTVVCLNKYTMLQLRSYQNIDYSSIKFLFLVKRFYIFLKKIRNNEIIFESFLHIFTRLSHYCFLEAYLNDGYQRMGLEIIIPSFFLYIVTLGGSLKTIYRI